MALLGGLVAWLLCLALLAALAAIPALLATHLWQRVQRERKRARLAQLPAYDRAYVRALDSIAERNARREAEAHIAALQA